MITKEHFEKLLGITLVQQFEKIAGVKLIEKDGKLLYDGNLDLDGRKDITELPDNLKVLGGLDLSQSGITKLPKGLEVEKWLDISKTDIEELPEDTKVGDSLYANNMKKPFSFPKVVKVNGNFVCTDTIINRMPEELYTECDCHLLLREYDKLPNIMEVGGNLYLFTSLLIEELPKGLIVRGFFDICNTNLKDYSKLHEVCVSFVITEEKYKEIKDTLLKHRTYNMPYSNYVCITFEPNYKGAYLFVKENGKFIYADYTLGKIVEQKGNIYYILKIRSKEISYLLTDGKDSWSHGYTLKEAKDDFIYKINGKDKSDYKKLTLYSELSFVDAITCYRVVTHALPFIIKDIVEKKFNENRKDYYTIKEFIYLTKGEYGNGVFKKFFCKS